MTHIIRSVDSYSVQQLSRIADLWRKPEPGIRLLIHGGQVWISATFLTEKRISKKKVACMIKVYVHPHSPFSQRVLFLLEELKLSYKLIPVWLEKGEQLAPSFKTLNPACRVPVLTVHNEALSESRAILRYLADKSEASGLYPVTPWERAATDQWMEFTGTHIGPSISSLAWENYWKPKHGMKPDPVLVNMYNEKIKRDLPVLESRLTNRRFLCQETLTLADMTAIPHIADLAIAGAESRPQATVLEWFNRLTERKSWKKVMSITAELSP